jgi:DNA-binding transcriptional ArsR family regulator
MVEAALKAIADPRRQDILVLVHENELSAGDIASRFDITRPAISQHLRVLVDTGLVSMRRDGTKRLYKARPEGLEEVRAFLDQFWGRSLDLLKQAAEQEQQGETID